MSLAEKFRNLSESRIEEALAKLEKGMCASRSHPDAIKDAEIEKHIAEFLGEDVYWAQTLRKWRSLSQKEQSEIAGNPDFGEFSFSDSVHRLEVASAFVVAARLISPDAKIPDYLLAELRDEKRQEFVVSRFPIISTEDIARALA